MKSISYVVSDSKNNSIIGAIEVLGQGSTEATINQLCVDVASAFAKTNEQTLSVKATCEEHKVMVYIERRSARVDDGFVTYGEYIKDLIGSLVISMHRKAGGDHA